MISPLRAPLDSSVTPEEVWLLALLDTYLPENALPNNKSTAAQEQTITSNAPIATAFWFLFKLFPPFFSMP